MNRTERIAAYFKQHPGEWIDGVTLETLGSRYAWRTRVSDCRKLGMRIDNRITRRADGSRISAYRFVPASLLEQMERTA